MFLHRVRHLQQKSPPGLQASKVFCSDTLALVVICVYRRQVLLHDNMNCRQASGKAPAKSTAAFTSTKHSFRLAKAAKKSVPVNVSVGAVPFWGCTTAAQLRCKLPAFSLLVSSDGPLTDGGAFVTGHLQCQQTLHTLMRFPLVVLVMLSPLRMLPL